MPATKTKRAKRTEAPVPAKFVDAVQAAEILGVTYDAIMEDYAGYLTDARPPHLRGRGSRRLFLRNEIDLLASDGWEGLADFRRRMNRIQPGGKHGRKR